MSRKKTSPWIRVLGASIALLGSAALFNDMRSQTAEREDVAIAQPASYSAAESDRNYSLVAANTTSTSVANANSELPPCPTPAQKTTGILIEGDRPGENAGRKGKIEAVVRQNNLQGKWCISAKTGNATWNIDGVSVDEAVRTFNLFKDAGLVSLARPTDSATAGRVTWQPVGVGGGTQNVAAEMPEIADVPNRLPSQVANAPIAEDGPRVAEPGRGQPFLSPCPQKSARMRNSSMMGRSPMHSGYRRPAGI